MAHFPNETPHAIANKRAASESDDKGALYIVRPHAERVVITVRAPGEARESSISLPLDDFRKLVTSHL